MAPNTAASGSTDLPMATKQPIIPIQKDVDLGLTGLATTAASSGSETSSSASGTIPSAPKQPNNNVQKDDFMQRTVLAPNTAASNGTMSPMDISGTHVLNLET